MNMSKIRNYNNDDFLRGTGAWDDTLITVGSFTLNSSDIVPLNHSRLKEADMKLVVSRIPQYPFIVSKWRSVVGANGRRVVVNTSDNSADSTRARKKRLQNATYRLLYSRKKFRKIEAQIIELISREGMAIVRLTEDAMPVVDSRFRYNMYWDEIKKTLRYAYLDPVTNKEMPGLTNLREGGELYVIRHPSFEAWQLPLSPVETILLIAKLEFHATVANQKIFDNGMIGQVFLQLAKELLPDVRKSLAEDKDDKPSWFTQLMRRINDKFRGSRNANQVSFFPGLEGILEVGKNNKDMQFLEMLTDLTPARIAWNWLLTPTDFGTGNAQTQNNVSIFDDSLYDKFGQHIERQLDEMTNEWLLPALGVNTTESFYVEYIPPEDPKKLEQLKQALLEYEKNGITLNEFREIKGLPPIEGGDRLFHEIVQSQAPSPVLNSYIDVEAVQPRRGYRESSPDFFSQAREFRATNVDKALDSDDYETFLKRFTKAVKKQITEYAESIESLDEAPDTVELKPLETYYSFPAMKKDLLKFAGVALDSVRKDKRTTFSMKRDYFDGEYPQSVLDFIDNAVERLLKGDDEFKSVDVETAAQIETIIKANISDGVFEIAKKIIEQVDTISFNRAELIAQTEVANAVEGTREIMYTTDPVFDGGKKKAQTSVNDVCKICTTNEDQGLIDISAAFKSGEKRATFHPRCRCDILYYTADEV